MQTADYQPLEQEQYVLEENGALRPPAPPPPELLPSVERMVAENPRLARALLAIALVSVLVLAVRRLPSAARRLARYGNKRPSGVARGACA